MKSRKSKTCALPRDLLRASPPLAKGGQGGSSCNLLQRAEISEVSRATPPYPPFARGGERERDARRNKSSFQPGPLKSPPKRTFQQPTLAPFIKGGKNAHSASPWHFAAPRLSPALATPGTGRLSRAAQFATIG
jgi:hypothetical protein